MGSHSRPDIELAEKLGWKFVGYTSTNKRKYRHPEVDRIIILCNIRNDWQGLRNKMAEIRRLTPRKERVRS